MYRRYYHEVKAMLSEGRSQREIAEHLGLRDKNVVKDLLKRERRKEGKIKAGLKLRPKGGHGKEQNQRISWQSRRMKSNV